MNNDKVFLNRMKIKIENGEYDQFMTLPFMTKKLFFANIKNRMEHRLETGGTPVMSDIEIKAVIDDMKETAGATFYLLVKHGILEKTDEGKYELSKKGILALNTR
jgi:hypothetical protein